MENVMSLFVPALFALILLRLLALPIRLGWKLLCNSFFGFLCLWILNQAASVTGLLLPINGITVLIAGALGLPGIGLIALLEWGI